MTIPYQTHSKIKKLSYNPDCNLGHRDYFSIFVGKAFWIWDKQIHRQEHIKTDRKCCFNHIVGSPEKNNQECPIFNFQKLIFDAVEQNQNIWILKSRGIGLTTFLVRYLAWKYYYLQSWKISRFLL